MLNSLILFNSEKQPQLERQELLKNKDSRITPELHQS